MKAAVLYIVVPVACQMEYVCGNKRDLLAEKKSGKFLGGLRGLTPKYLLWRSDWRNMSKHVFISKHVSIWIVECCSLALAACAPQPAKAEIGSAKPRQHYLINANHF